MLFHRRRMGEARTSRGFVNTTAPAQADAPLNTDASILGLVIQKGHAYTWVG